MNFSGLISSLRFSNPGKNDVVILYPHDYWIRQFILKDIPATTLGVFGDQPEIFVTLQLIARTMGRLKLIRWDGVRKNSFVKNLLMEIYIQYILACLDQIQAKLVLTIVDNSNLFHSLSRIDKKRVYFAVQNGTRTIFCARDSQPFPQNTSPENGRAHVFCFGRRDIDLFQKYGYPIASFEPTGSLVGGYYKSMVSVPVEKPRYDLCLISQWHGHFFEEIAGDHSLARLVRNVRAGMEILNDLLVRLIKDAGLSLVICLRNPSEPEERAYFQKIFGDKAEIVKSEPRKFSTYRAIEQSRLTLALNSTVLAEIFAWGQKTLWCNVTEDEYFEMPEAGIGYFHGNDYNAFKERVLKLLAMSQEDYVTQTREGAQYINCFDPDHPPHEIIRSAVKQRLAQQGS